MGTSSLDYLIQLYFPELIEQQTAHIEQSCAHSRFMPEKALKDGACNPWEQLGRDVRIAKKKTIVLSSKDPFLLTIYQKLQFDRVANLLKQAGFSTLILFKDQLATYEMHFLVPEKYPDIAAKTKKEIFAMAASGLTPEQKKIPADDLYIFDPLSNQHGDQQLEQWIKQLSNLFCSPLAIGHVSVWDNAANTPPPVDAKTLLFQNKHEPISPKALTNHAQLPTQTSEEILESILWQMLPKETSHLLHNDTCTSLIEKTYALLQLINTPEIPLSQLMALPKALQIEILEHRGAVISWVRWGISLDMLANFEAGLRFTLLQNLTWFN